MGSQAEPVQYLPFTGCRFPVKPPTANSHRDLSDEALLKPPEVPRLQHIWIRICVYAHSRSTSDKGKEGWQCALHVTDALFAEDPTAKVSQWILTITFTVQ